MYKVVIEGRGGITARIVADSVNEEGVRLTTFELDYHRYIHGELMTHRMFSRNAMSSRAVPISKMINQVRDNPATPIHWGKNQAGMQAKEELSGLALIAAQYGWQQAALTAGNLADDLSNGGAHKQIVNRILEPFQMMKTVVTATEFNNFCCLRDHSDAQPEIQELAKCMIKAFKLSKPELLKVGEWHTPYVEHFRASTGDAQLEYIVGGLGVTKEEALKVSSSCCAQVSYRVLDDSLEKALMIYDKLIESKPTHASPTEHQGTPISVDDCFPDACDEGITHIDTKGDMWSGNFKGWVQYRQLIKDNYVEG